MKEVKLSKVKDGVPFYLSKRSKVQYKIIRKWTHKYDGGDNCGKKMATITSLSSERSFVKSLDTVCYL